MNYIFTKHVKLRIEQRKLSEEQIKEALNKPDKVLEGKFGRKLAQKKFDGKTLEVVFNRESNNFIIITAYYMRIKEG